MRTLKSFTNTDDVLAELTVSARRLWVTKVDRAWADPIAQSDEWILLSGSDSTGAPCIVGSHDNAVGFSKNRYAVRVMPKSDVSDVLKQTLVPVIIIDATVEQQSDVELLQKH